MRNYSKSKHKQQKTDKSIIYTLIPLFVLPVVFLVFGAIILSRYAPTKTPIPDSSYGFRSGVGGAPPDISPTNTAKNCK